MTTEAEKQYQMIQDQAEAWLIKEFPGSAGDSYWRFTGTEMTVAFLAGFSAALKYSADLLRNAPLREALNKEVQDNDC